MRKLLPLILVALLAFPAYAQDKETPKTEQKQEKSLEELLKELGHEDYEVREKATQDLIKKGQKELDKQTKNIKTKLQALYEKTKDPEVKARAQYVLRQLKGVVTPKQKKDTFSKPVTPPKKLPIPGLPKEFNKLPMPELPKELDLGKIFEGGQGLDLNKIMEQMGMPKEFGEMFKGLFPETPEAPPVKEKKTQSKPKDFFGIAWQKPSEAFKTQLGLKNGIIVTEVAKNSYAEKNGLQKHDIILCVEEEHQKGHLIITINITDVNQAKDLEVLKKKGYNVRILRKGKYKTLKFSQWK